MGVARLCILAFLLALLASCEDLFSVPGVEEVQPNAPSRFTSVDYTDGVLTLRWEDVSNVETGYAVERSGSMDGDDFTRFTSLAADSEEFQVGVSKPGRYRVAVLGGSAPLVYLFACLYYEDSDGDGSGTNLAIAEGICPAARASFQTGDCDDHDPDRFPYNRERCDGKDNNCLGVADEGFPGLGGPCTIGAGECAREGTTLCSSDGAGVMCQGTSAPPAAEICDGKDNDCDGTADEADTCRLSVVATFSPGDFSTSCAASGSRIYCIGGFASPDRIFAYDPSTRAATTLRTRVPWSKSSVSACTGLNGKIYCFVSFTKSFMEYDTIADTASTWSTSLASPLQSLSCAASSGKIYCFGGYADDSPGPLKQIFEYDPARNSVAVKAATLPFGQYGASCVSLGSTVYCLGGTGSAVGIQDQILAYDSQHDVLSVASARLPTPRGSHSCAAALGRIYCFGGWGPRDVRLDEIAEYDPSTERVRILDDRLPSARVGLGCATSDGGKIYCFGGIGPTGKYLDEIVELDPGRYWGTPESDPRLLYARVLPGRAPISPIELELDSAREFGFGCSMVPFGPR